MVLTLVRTEKCDECGKDHNGRELRKLMLKGFMDNTSKVI